MKRQPETEKAWAEVMKERYPRPGDWYRVRFSDELHFGYDPQAKLRIIRKPRERQYCPNYIQEDKEPEEKDQKNAIIFGPQQAMIPSLRYTLMMCRETKESTLIRFLGPIAKPWIGAHHDFVLEEDGDFRAWAGKNQILCGLGSRKIT